MKNRLVTPISVFALCFQAPFAQCDEPLEALGVAGDVVQCTASPLNGFSGTYAVDYLVTYPSEGIAGPSGSASDGLAQVSDVDASIKRIRALLHDKAPTLEPSFNDFANHIQNTTDATADRVWQETQLSQDVLPEEGLVALMPPNCRVAGQVVGQRILSREFVPVGWSKARTVYSFAADSYHSLEVASPTQLSYLLVHQWLLEFSRNTDRNRRVNRLLHSKAIETMTPAKVAMQLHGMGFPVPEKPPEAIDPYSCVGVPLTEEQLSTGSHAAIASLVDQSRERECESSPNGCHDSWNSSFFPAPAYVTASSYYLKIGSAGESTTPPLITISNTQAQNAIMLRCHIVSQSQGQPDGYEGGNLECSIAPSWIGYFVAQGQPETGWASLPEGLRPRFRGTLTQNCMQISLRSYFNEEIVSAIGDHQRTVERRVGFYFKFD